MEGKSLKTNIMSDVQHKIFSKQVSGYKHRARLYIVLHCYFVFVTVCLLAVPVGAEIQDEKQLSAESPNRENGEPHLTISESSVVKETKSALRQQLQQARISIYQDEKDSKGKNELKQVIEQIQSIVFNSLKQPLKSISVTGPGQPVIEPDEVLLDTKTQEKPEKTPAQPKPKKLIKSECQYESLNEHTLQILENLTQTPDQLKNPFELAEVLFFSGHTKEATMFYQEAFNRKDPNDIDSAREKAWILFQIGNCQRNNDLQSAKKTYRQLIAEYPDYPWTDLAKVREKLIDWHLGDKPYVLIKECEQLASGK